MSDVIICGLLIGGLVGLPVGLVIAIGRNTWWGKMLSFIICCAIFFGCGAMIGQEHINDCNTFNNGVCIQCGGEYRMSGATRTRMGSKTFYYTCQDCGWTIETNGLMNKH